MPSPPGFTGKKTRTERVQVIFPTFHNYYVVSPDSNLSLADMRFLDSTLQRCVQL